MVKGNVLVPLQLSSIFSMNECDDNDYDGEELPSLLLKLKVHVLQGINFIK